jgi:hypothetical protein
VGVGASGIIGIAVGVGPALGFGIAVGIGAAVGVDAMMAVGLGVVVCTTSGEEQAATNSIGINTNRFHTAY